MPGFLSALEVCPKTGMVYVKALRIEGEVVTKKTFFPPEWTRKQVIDKIVEASRNLVEPPKCAQTWKIYKGATAEGMQIEIVVDETQKIRTAFPVDL